VADLIGQTIDPTRIDQEIIDGRPYWQLIPDVEYSISGNQRKGCLLVAPAMGFERAIVKTPEGVDHEMTPAYYSAEILLGGSYQMLTLRFFRIEVGQADDQVRRRMVDAVPSPLVEDFLPRVQRLVQGGLRVVKTRPKTFEALAREAAKAPGKKKARKAPAKKKAKASAKKAPAKAPKAPAKKKATVKASRKSAKK